MRLVWQYCPWGNKQRDDLLSCVAIVHASVQAINVTSSIKSDNLASQRLDIDIPRRAGVNVDSVYFAHAPRSHLHNAVAKSVLVSRMHIAGLHVVLGILRSLQTDVQAAQ